MKIFKGLQQLKTLWNIGTEYWFGSYSRYLIDKNCKYNDKDRIIISTSYESGSDEISDYLKIASPNTLFNIQFTIDLILIERFWEYVIWDFTGVGLEHLEEKKLELSFNYAPENIKKMYNLREFMLRAYHPLRYIRYMMKGYKENKKIEELLNDKDFLKEYKYKQKHLFDENDKNFNKKGCEYIIKPIKEYAKKFYPLVYEVVLK